MRWSLCAAFVSVCALSAFAQQPQHAPARYKEAPPGTIHSIKVNGAHLYSSQDIIAASGLKIGQRVTGPMIEQARLKLENTELFISVADEFWYSAADPPAYDITIDVAENTQLFPMRFERLGVSSDVIRQYLHDHVELYADQIPGTEAVLRRYTSAIDSLVQKTNPSLKVKALISNDDPKQLTVLFTSDKPAPIISQVHVNGNEAVDTGTILRAVNQVAVGVPLSDMRLKQILDGSIKPLYAAKGYAAVSFPKVEVEPSKNNLGVIVNITINDGPVFKFGAIRFHGSGMDEDEIRSTIPFKPGQPFNGDKVDNFRLQMVHSMRHKGLLDASVHTDIQPDGIAHVVNVTYEVVPGSVYNFRKLDIDGLDMVTEGAIARLWGEKQGHAFNPEYPDYFLKRVQEEGLLDNLADTRSDYTADASTHDVTVHLYFKGGESAQEKAKKKKEEEDKRKVDGTWSPWPQ